MTFTTEEIKRIDVDGNYEWRFPDLCNTRATVMLDVYEDFKKRVCDFFGISYDEVIYNGWIDVYANIDVVEKRVDSIYFDIVPNDDEISPEKELEISITNNVEANELYAQLATTNGFEEFIDECIQAQEDNE